MVLFTCSFLPETVRITIKDHRTWRAITESFHFFPGREFTSAICKNYWKQSFERLLTEDFFKMCQHFQYTLPVLMFQEEHQHEIAVLEC